MRISDWSSDVCSSDLVGVTTNPSIFQSAVSTSDLYDPQVHDLAVRGVAVDEAVRAITTADVREACDVLRPAYDASSEERRVGKECVSTCRSRWSPSH